MLRQAPPTTAPRLRQFSASQLLIALAALIIAFPFVEKLKTGSFIISILFTLVLISGVLAVEQHRLVLITASALTVPTLVCRWLNYYWPSVVPPEFFLIGAIMFILFVVVSLLRFILSASFITTDVLLTAVSTYLMLGLLWAMAYWFVAELIPNAFAFNVVSAGDTSMKGFNSLYFSFVTLSTVGYGDITPVASSARILAAGEATIGLLYMGILIARLVAIHSNSKANVT